MVQIRPLSDLTEKYLRRDNLPTIWCAGCGLGIATGALLRALDDTKLPPTSFCFVCGVGCHGAIGYYLNFDEVRVPHGRALAYATGMKLYKPNLNVIVVMGDGDASAIGGNHLIHAARRNVDLTAIVMNNHIYGQTGGQCSPTTPYGAKATTAPFGTLERSFDICRLVEAAGATFVARGTVYHTRQLIGLFLAGIRHKGFALIEVDCPCPVNYGRRVNLSAIDMLKLQKEKAITTDQTTGFSEDQLKDKIVTGVLVEKQELELSAEYWKMVERVQRGG